MASPRPPQLAIYNFGIFREPADSPVNQGFMDREAANFLAAERAVGFVARAGYADEPDRPSWGERVYPRFYLERGDGSSPSTLSVWENLESLFAFAYSGIHAEALRRGSDWFVERRWPAYVLWWVDSGQFPDWREAVFRFERLHDRGPTREAFNFKTPFDPLGEVAAVDRAAVKRIAEANRLRPAIRAYRPDDLDVVISIFLAAIRETASRDYSPAEVDAWAEVDRDRWALRRLDRPTWVALIDDSVVGFTDLEADGHLDMMFVHPRRQRLGVATALLGAVETAARTRGLSRIFTEASRTGRPFFESRGFSVIEAQVVEKPGQRPRNYRMEKLSG